MCVMYGMVWYGMVWYGMVWYGMVWYGMVWYGTYVRQYVGVYGCAGVCLFVWLIDCMHVWMGVDR